MAALGNEASSPPAGSGSESLAGDVGSHQDSVSFSHGRNDSHQGSDSKNAKSSATAGIDRATSSTSSAEEGNLERRRKENPKAQTPSAGDQTLRYHQYAMADDKLSIARRRIEGLNRYSNYWHLSEPLQQLLGPWVGPTFPRYALRENFGHPLHFLLSQNHVIAADTDLALLNALQVKSPPTVKDRAGLSHACALLLSCLEDEKHLLVHLGLLGHLYKIEPELYEVALEFMEARDSQSRASLSRDFEPRDPDLRHSQSRDPQSRDNRPPRAAIEPFESSVCILQLFGSTLIIQDASRSLSDQSNGYTPLLIALFIPSTAKVTDASPADQLWRYLCVDLQTLRTPPVVDVTDNAYVVARSWLRLLWRCYTVRGRWRTGWSVGGERLDEELRAYAIIVCDMKAGWSELQYWMRGKDTAPGGENTETTHRSRFEHEHKRATAEMTYLDDYFNRHVALESLSASRLSIVESRRGIEVSKKAMEVSEKAERQAHAIGRLTQLAFVFLPLTFVTGIFGMNIKQFNDGAPVWEFWVSLVCIVVPAFFFGVQTARKDLMDRWRQMQEIPSHARGRIVEPYRRRLPEGAVKDWVKYRSCQWLLDALGEGLHSLEYEEFLDKSRWWNILLGVGPSAALSSAFRRVRRSFDRSNRIIRQ